MAEKYKKDLSLAEQKKRRVRERSNATLAVGITVLACLSLTFAFAQATKAQAPVDAATSVVRFEILGGGDRSACSGAVINTQATSNNKTRIDLATIGHCVENGVNPSDTFALSMNGQDNYVYTQPIVCREYFSTDQPIDNATLCVLVVNELPDWIKALPQESIDYAGNWQVGEQTLSLGYSGELNYFGDPSVTMSISPGSVKKVETIAWDDYDKQTTTIACLSSKAVDGESGGPVFVDDKYRGILAHKCSSEAPAGLLDPFPENAGAIDIPDDFDLFVEQVIASLDEKWR